MQRDDIIEYSLDAHHSEEKGKSIRKKIYFVTILLSVITAIEVAMGIAASGWIGVKWELVKWAFIAMTVVKAGYIVMVFMHLKDERKSFRYLLIIAYIFFILYIVALMLNEAFYQSGLREGGMM